MKIIWSRLHTKRLFSISAVIKSFGNWITGTVKKICLGIIQMRPENALHTLRSAGNYSRNREALHVFAIVRAR